VVAIVADPSLPWPLVQEKGLSLFYNQQIKLAGIIASSLSGGCAGLSGFQFLSVESFYGRQRFLVPRFFGGMHRPLIGAFKTTILAVSDCSFSFGGDSRSWI